MKQAEAAIWQPPSVYMVLVSDAGKWFSDPFCPKIWGFREREALRPVVCTLLGFPKSMQVAVCVHGLDLITLAKCKTDRRLIARMQQLALVALFGLQGDPLDKMIGTVPTAKVGASQSYSPYADYPTWGTQIQEIREPLILPHEFNMNEDIWLHSSHGFLSTIKLPVFISDLSVYKFDNAISEYFKRRHST